MFSKIALLSTLLGVPSLALAQGGDSEMHGPRPFKTVIFHHYIGAGHTAAAEAIARTREASGQIAYLSKFAS